MKFLGMKIYAFLFLYPGYEISYSSIYIIDITFLLGILRLCFHICTHVYEQLNGDLVILADVIYEWWSY